MYKTAKGIEYGVGTQFTTHSHNDKGLIIHTITKIDNDKVYVSIPSYNTSYPLYKFGENLDIWKAKIITPSTDYKLVDSKSITFDFTNTKIKVNNEDEGKWLYGCIIANGYYRAGGTHTFYEDLKGIFFYSGKQFNTTTKELDYNTHYSEREITIQDILNKYYQDRKDYATKIGTKFHKDILNNMKEVIEVGDKVINTFSQNTYTVVATKVVNGKLELNMVGYPNIWVLASAHTLVSKASAKEVVAYETVVDLPGIPKGSKSHAPYLYEFKYNNKFYTAPLAEINDTKFFKPIYKQDAIELKFSKYTATLSKEGGLVFSDNEKVSYKSLKYLLNALIKVNVQTNPIDSYKVNIVIDIKEVQVGCKYFTFEDVKLVTKAVEELES